MLAVLLPHLLLRQQNTHTLQHSLDRVLPSILLLDNKPFEAAMESRFHRHLCSSSWWKIIFMMKASAQIITFVRKAVRLQRKLASKATGCLLKHREQQETALQLLLFCPVLIIPFNSQVWSWPGTRVSKLNQSCLHLYSRQQSAHSSAHGLIQGGPVGGDGPAGR